MKILFPETSTRDDSKESWPAILPPVLFESDGRTGLAKEFSSKAPKDAAVRPPRNVRRSIACSPSMALYALDLAAVHTHRRASHPLRRRRYEITHQVGNLFGQSQARDASLLREFLDCLFYCEIVRRRPGFKERPSAPCHHRPRRYAVDLHAVFNSFFCECLSERVNGCIDRSHRRISGLGIQSGASGHEHHRSVRGLQSVPSLYGQAACAVELERHAVVPLRVRHLEQIDLRHSARNIEQRIDSAKTFERSFG